MQLNFKLNLLFIFSILCFTTFAQYQIGHYTKTFIDPDRGNRAIETEIYYPANAQGNNTPIASGDFPVIVFGHGFVMVWDAYENLWEEFVPRGYIMAFPKTEGNLFSTDHQQFGWDLQFLVLKIQDEGNNSLSALFNGVNNNTALMGHSMGGGASFLAADSLCTNGNIQLKTIVGLAPAESTSNGVSSINSAVNVTIPSLVFSGSQDGVTPPIDHHLPIYNSLSSDCKTFISVTGGGHCYFANPNFNCDFGESTSSTGISISRAQQHAVTFDFLNLWLDYTLKDDCDSFSTFQDSLAQSSRITNNQNCVQNPIPIINENAGMLTCSVSGIGYQWFLNNSPIAGANSINYSPTTSGNYTVEVTFNDGCPTLSLEYIFSLTSINNNTNFKQEIHLYPNPTSNTIHLQIDRLYNNITLKLKDCNGRLISTKHYSSLNHISFNMNGFSNGFYILELTNSKASFARFGVIKK